MGETQVFGGEVKWKKPKQEDWGAWWHGGKLSQVESARYQA